MGAAFGKGDRVIATTDLGGMFTAAVRRGEAGVVIRMDEGFMRDTFTVKFDNDEVVEAREEDLYAES